MGIGAVEVLADVAAARERPEPGRRGSPSEKRFLTLSKSVRFSSERKVFRKTLEFIGDVKVGSAISPNDYPRATT